MFGVLAVNKPAGFTSRDVVNRIQRVCRPVKVGHTGTLDPLATGVLLVAVGNATRLVEFSHELPKSYEADFQLGCRSDTLDIEGKLETLEQSYVPSKEELERESHCWTGRVKQVPPKYSAININGKRAYELARKGADFQLVARTVEINSIRISHYEYPHLTLRIQCGSGTYIRSLGSDLARGVSSDAVMTRLVRTAIGPIQLAQCVPLEDLSDAVRLEGHLLPASVLVARMPKAVLKSCGCTDIRHGIPVSTQAFVGADHVGAERLAAFDEGGELVAILKLDGRDHYRSLRVFQVANETSQPSNSSTPHKPES